MSLLCYIATYALYGFSIFASFLFTGFLIRPLTLKDIEEDIEEDKLLQKRIEEENFQYKYMDEYEKLEETEIDYTKLKETTLEIPFLKIKIIIFYEENDNTFKYYSNTDVIYKYLNVACRKFVIENNAKKLYIDGNLEEVISESVKSELFVTKAETKLLERKFNHFIRVGSIHDYNNKNNIKLIKEIDIIDFLKLCQTK
jgi:hypothetical protein